MFLLLVKIRKIWKYHNFDIMQTFSQTDILKNSLLSDCYICLYHFSFVTYNIIIVLQRNWWHLTYKMT